MRSLVISSVLVAADLSIVKVAAYLKPSLTMSLEHLSPVDFALRAHFCIEKLHCFIKLPLDVIRHRQVGIIWIIASQPLAE